MDEVEDVFVNAPTSATEISAPFVLGADSAQVNVPADTLESAQPLVASAVQVKSAGAGREGASFGTQTNAFGSMATPRDNSRGNYSAGESRQRTELPSKAAIASYGALLQTPFLQCKRSRLSAISAYACDFRWPILGNGDGG